MPQVVGIDLGTSNSTVAGFLNGQYQVFPDERDERLTPSIVSFGKNKKILIGSDAKSQAHKNPKKTVHSIKRLIGRKFFSSEIKKAQALLPYTIVEGEHQQVLVEVGDQKLTPQEIAGLILNRMKVIAEHQLNESIGDCVITVPAYFNDNQRTATQEASTIAGLNAVRILNEPTAAALAYGFGKSKNETVIVYDLGGGTFDISVLRLRDKIFEVIATAGDTFLGGDDFDDRIIDILAEDFLKKNKIDLRKIKEALPLLRTNAEKTKRRLSYAEHSDIYIPSIFQKDGDALDLHFSLSREDLKNHSKDLIQRTFKVCDEALSNGGIKTTDVDAIILVGGPTKMPLIIDAVRDYFGKNPLNDLNPDEVVSIGAAIQGSTLSSQTQQKKSLLIDVTPLDLGVATVDGFTETLIEKNSPIPTTASKIFTTTQDDQEAVTIRIFQGTNRREENSHLLGDFELSGFAPKKAGQVDIEVNFAIDTDGLVKVSAVETETGVEQRVQVKLTSALGNEMMSESQRKNSSFKPVSLKDPWKGAAKVFAYRCGDSSVNSEFIEGYVRSFHPENPSFLFESDSRGVKPKEFAKSLLAWAGIIHDFSNLPRYMKALLEEPNLDETAKDQPLYKFILSNGEAIYGIAQLPEDGSKNFWIQTCINDRALKARFYLYRNKIKEIVTLG